MPSRKMHKIRQLAQQICPPIILTWIKLLVKRARNIRATPLPPTHNGATQDLEIYWDPKMAQLLETWGEANVWKELPLLMVNCHGKVLDIACGTGKTMEVIKEIPLELHGCDISDLLIEKAIDRGIKKDRLKVCDATNLPYENDQFDYAYSIGSLEHFTEEGIALFLRECHRVVRNTSFHQIPVSRDGKNHGWIKTYQSYHNNSVSWWLSKYQAIYQTVYVLESTWEDAISVGKWFVCVKNEANQHAD